MSDIIQMTESSFRDEKIKDIITHVYGVDNGSRDLTVQNIIDLNIVPINVHALMREIPLANLYNYAYTFDRMIAEFIYGVKGMRAFENMTRILCDTKVGTQDRDLTLQSLIPPSAADKKNVKTVNKAIDDLNNMKVAEANLGTAADIVGMLVNPYGDSTNPSYTFDVTGIDGLSKAKFLYDNADMLNKTQNHILTRNIVFIVNMYRVVRLKLQKDLVYDKEIIQSSAAITKNSLTEYFGNEKFTKRGDEDFIKARKERYNYS
jgi:hypothetical protein